MFIGRPVNSATNLSTARCSSRELLGIQRLQGLFGDPPLHEDLSHRLLPGTHSQSTSTKWDAAQRPPGVQRLCKSVPADGTNVFMKSFVLWTVYFVPQGLKDASEEKGKLLGVYTYNQDGDALQTFVVTVSKVK